MFAAEYFYNFFINFHYNAGTILEANHIEWWSQKGFRDADIASVDAECILALLVSAIQLERVNEGLLSSFFRDGSIVRWLSRLKEIDDQREAAEEVEDYDEFDDEESGGVQSDNSCFIAFQNALKCALEKYQQMHSCADVERFVDAITDELAHFSKGEAISRKYWFVLDGWSFSFYPDSIEMSDSDENLYTFWLNGHENLPYYFNMSDFNVIVRLVSDGAKLTVIMPDEFGYDDSEDESEIDEDSE